jgi:predicted CopG family antitoxin
MVKTQGKRRSTPPSRRRYEASHPTVSFRVDLDLYPQLKGLKEKANLSVADVLKISMERRETLVGEAHHTGFMSALARAYEAVCEDCEDQLMAIAIA